MDVSAQGVSERYWVCLQFTVFSFVVSMNSFVDIARFLAIRISDDDHAGLRAGQHATVDADPLWTNSTALAQAVLSWRAAHAAHPDKER